MIPERPRDSSTISGDAYAWGKTARIVTEDHFFSVLRSNPNFVAVDLCSAYPFYSRIMKGQYKVRAHRAGRGYVGQLLDRAFRKRIKLENRFTSLTGIDDDAFLKLKEELEENEDEARYLLRAPVFELLYDPPSELTGPSTPGKVEKIEDYLRERLKNSSVIYTSIREAPRKYAEEGWHFILSSNMGSTFAGTMEKILGKEITNDFIDDLAKQLSSRLVGNLVRFSMFSLDIRNFSAIRREAKKSFPKDLRHTFFYKSAREPGHHVQGDIKQLPFPPESIAFFSCIEGWPFYLGEDSEENQLKIAYQIATMLQPGGRAVFFPWRFQNQKMSDKVVLKKLEEVWRSKGLIIYHEAYNVEELQNEMSDREYMLVDKSPVFKERVRNLSVLVLEKPAA